MSHLNYNKYTNQYQLTHSGMSHVNIENKYIYEVQTVVRLV